MPHKHTRKVKDDDPASFNLPPSSIARPLPVTQSSSSSAGKKRKRDSAQAPQDDTPKAFTRALKIMKYGRKRAAPDDGDDTHLKRKLKNSQSKSRSMKRGSRQASETLAQSSKLTIRPSERLSEFSARVNQALPVAGLSKGSKQAQQDKFGKLLKERQTKTEKRMQRMQAEWRAEDATIKEREEEARELAEEEQEKHWGGASRFPSEPKTERRSKRNRRLGDTSSSLNDDDPWASLRLAREQRKGLHDYAQEPPKLKEVREKLKMKHGAMVDVADVPVAAGSLRRREELGSARKDIIAGYRKMMEDRRRQD